MPAFAADMQQYQYLGTANDKLIYKIGGSVFSLSVGDVIDGCVVMAHGPVCNNSDEEKKKQLAVGAGAFSRCEDAEGNVKALESQAKAFGDSVADAEKQVEKVTGENASLKIQLAKIIKDEAVTSCREEPATVIHSEPEGGQTSCTDSQSIASIMEAKAKDKKSKKFGHVKMVLVGDKVLVRIPIAKKEIADRQWGKAIVRHDDSGAYAYYALSVKILKAARHKKREI
jgi:hypothetical protein